LQRGQRIVVGALPFAAARTWRYTKSAVTATKTKVVQPMLGFYQNQV
jgi:hypothetical protein